MEQFPDPVAVKTRDHLANQLGYQLASLCELNARVEVLTAQLAQMTAERDEWKAKAEQE